MLAVFTPRPEHGDFLPGWLPIRTNHPADPNTREAVARRGGVGTKDALVKDDTGKDATAKGTSGKDAPVGDMEKTPPIPMSKWSFAYAMNAYGLKLKSVKYTE